MCCAPGGPDLRPELAAAGNVKAGRARPGPDFRRGGPEGVRCLDELGRARCCGQWCEPLNRGGLGLGLTISKTLLDLHGGTISVESARKDQGTTFRVSLNLLQKPVKAATEKVSKGVTAPKSLRLLLVDDHADTRAVLSRLLTKSGHEVVTADSADKALKILDGGRFDALISDIGLPDCSGYELVREVKRRQPLKGIALSGLGMDEDVLRSMEAGFDCHLTKPINFQELKSVLEKIG